MTQSQSGVTRRGVFGVAAAAGASALVACSEHSVSHARVNPGPASSGVAGSVPFFGPHQAGITTPAQAYLTFLAFDLETDAALLRSLLNTWSAAAAEMTAGREAPHLESTDFTDSGEALGAPSAGLTVTIGYGPGLFKLPGLQRRLPPALKPLPAFATDNLDDGLCGGDIALQICADDPLICYHAARQLIRLAEGSAHPRWTVTGFRGPQLGGRSRPITRNLFGFHDGVNNPALDDARTLDQTLWVPRGDGPAWMAGGTYLVTRQIRLLTGGWDELPTIEQERIIGRSKRTGAPLSGGTITSEMNLAASAADGGPAIPVNAHIRLAAASTNNGASILRRSYAYADHIGNGGQASQLFCAYQRDPARGFIPIQEQLAASDALNQHTQHVGSAMFAVPPGLRPRAGWGDQLLA